MNFSNEGVLNNSKKFSEEFQNRSITPPLLSADILSMLANINHVGTNSDLCTLGDLSKAIKKNNCEKVIQILGEFS